MDRGSNQLKVVDQDPKALIRLINALRRAGYNIGFSQYIAAQDIMLALLAMGDGHHDTERIKRILGPVLCKSSQEQEAFGDYFQSYLLKDAPISTEPPAQIPLTPKDESKPYPQKQVRETGPGSAIDRDGPTETKSKPKERKVQDPSNLVERLRVLNKLTHRAKIALSVIATVVAVLLVNVFLSRLPSETPLLEPDTKVSNRQAPAGGIPVDPDVSFVPDSSFIADSSQVGVQEELPANFAAVFSPDGTMLAVGSPDRTINLVDLETLDTLGTMSADLIPFIRNDNIVTNADTSWWPMTRSLQEFAWYQGLVKDVAYHTDAQQVALATDRSVKLWRVGPPSAQSVTEWSGHQAPIQSIAFSSNGQFLATGDTDGVLILRRPLQQEVTFTPNRGPIHSLALSRDGTRLTFSNSEGIVYRWNTVDNTLIDSLRSDLLFQDASNSATIRHLSYDATGSRLAGTGTDGRVVVWRTASRFITLQGIVVFWWPLVAALSVLIAACIIGFRLWQYYLARPFLVRLSSSEAPRIDYVQITKTQEVLYPDVSLHYISERLRRRKEVPSPQLDITNTVHASVVQGGAFTPVFGSRKEVPEYLALINRKTFGDHQAEGIDGLLDVFIENQVFLKRYYFDGDPRICFPEEDEEKPSTLPELLRRFNSHRLLIFSEASNFFSPVTGEREPWTDWLMHWEERALLTPEVPELWSHREDQLDGDFLIRPATLEGFDQLIEGSRLDTATQHSSLSFPDVLRWQPRRWIERNPPRKRQIEDMISAVRSYLGKDNFRWLAACAVYPAISWKLTKSLGYGIHDNHGRPLLKLEALAMLSRLPWLRFSYMPDWLRVRLLDELSSNEQKEVRDVIGNLLYTARLGDKETADLEFAHHDSFSRNLTRSLLQRWSKSASERDPIRDYVFVRFMSGKRPKKLTVRLPETIMGLFADQRRMMPEEQQPGKWRWVWFLLGGTSLAALLLAVFLFVWNLLHPSPLDVPEVLFTLDP